MNARRILIVTNRVPYPLHDGGALAIDAMIRGYREQGWQVWVLAMNTARHPVSAQRLTALYPEIEGFDAVPFDNRLKPLNLLQNLLFSRAPEHAQRFYTHSFEKALLAKIEAVNPDVIQFESLFLSGYLPAVRKATKAKTVLRLHNLEYQVWHRLAAEARGLKRSYLTILACRMQRYEAEIWPVYDALLGITEEDAQGVWATDPKLPVLVAPFGIKMSGQPLAPEPSFHSAYHVGAMDWLPNVAAIDWFLNKVWPFIRLTVPGARFHFAGRHMPERYHTQLPDGVQCCGEVPSVAAFIADKQILVVPLRAGGGIRVKILEAMAAGKLVISTETGMQGIDAQDGIHFLLANTPEAFAQAMHWCAVHTGAANAMRTAAFELVRTQYDLAAIAGRVTAFLDRLLHTHRNMQ